MTEQNERQTTPTPRPERGDDACQDAPPRKTAPSMHEDVQDWTDTCSCEPEPRWQAVEDENRSTDDGAGA